MYRPQIDSRRILFFLLYLPFLTACTQDEYGNQEPTPGNNGDIRFEISIAVPDGQTRTSTGADFRTVFKDGDEIGIFAVRHAAGATGSVLDLKADGTNFINNAKLTYVESTNTWTPANSICFPNNSDVLDFYAYYPYDATATNPTNIAFRVKTNQSITSNYAASDLLTARNNNSGTGYSKGQTVSLTFAHILAMVQVKIANNATNPLHVHLLKATDYCGIHLSNGIIDTNGSPQIITMYRVEQPNEVDYDSSFTYWALVPPQTIQIAFYYLTDDVPFYSGSTSTVVLTGGSVKLYETDMP